MIKPIIAAILLVSQLSSDYPVNTEAPVVEVVKDISIDCRYSYNQLQSPAEMKVYNTPLEGIMLNGSSLCAGKLKHLLGFITSWVLIPFIARLR